MQNYFPDSSGWSSWRRNQPQYQEDIKDFANKLHSLLCNYNHMDQCPWEYENGDWDRLRHQYYFNISQELMSSGAPTNLILDILKISKKVW